MTKSAESQGRGASGRAQLVVLLVCTALVVIAFILRRPPADENLAAALPESATRDGFTTSTTCQACHPDQYDSWHRSYHRSMTQAAGPASVLGSFDDVVVETRGLQWRLFRRGDEFWVEMPDPVWFEDPAWLMQLLDESWPDEPPRIEARVVMTTGSHHMQNYWVRRPPGDESSLAPDDGSLLELPWVWLIDEGRWVPNQDSFLTPAMASLGGVARWNANCSQCHSVGTVPGTSASYEHFDSRTVELGISCEACHGPAERHVERYRSPVRRYLRHLETARDPDAPDPTIINAAKLEQRRSAEVCGQCHSFGAWVDQDAYRTEGIPFLAGQDLSDTRRVFGYAEDPADPLLQEMLSADSLALEGRFWRDGTSRIAGREFNALASSTHYAVSEITCVTCHSLHEYEDRDSQLAPGAAGDAACQGCHDDFVDPAVIEEHTHHAAGSSGSECMNCHMPRTTYGLFTAMRSHRIDNPSVRVSQETGRPNACNLCHLDQTLEWAGRHLEAWYGQPLPDMDSDERSISAAAVWALEGDVAQRTLVAWHMGWEPAREASGERWLPPYLAQLLTDPYSATRRVAYRSLVTLPGIRGLRYDYVEGGREAAAKADEALRLWLRAGGPGPSEPRLLIAEDGRIDAERWLRLLGDRNLRPLTIRE